MVLNVLTKMKTRIYAAPAVKGLNLYLESPNSDLRFKSVAPILRLVITVITIYFIIDYLWFLSFSCWQNSWTHCAMSVTRACVFTRKLTGTSKNKRKKTSSIRRRAKPTRNKSKSKPQ